MQPVHPGWCDPRHCCFTDIDIQHRSTPTLLTTLDHEWWFTLARADGWDHPQQHGHTELRNSMGTSQRQAARAVSRWCVCSVALVHRRRSSHRRVPFLRFPGLAGGWLP